jgi:ATP adenylyltransferase
MDRLWTPWRFDYIRGIDHTDPSCVFCRILAEPDRDQENLVLCRRSALFVVLNIFPYTVGHVLIVANRHIASLGSAEAGELHALLDTATQCEAALEKEYRPEGINVGINLGRAAGAGVDHHLHMHILPRWTGDANFISTVSETRVFPEQLSQTYRRLLPYF